MEQILLKWDGKQTGVYCIRNKVSGKVYIGSSTNCYHRVKGQHYARLQKGTHSNPHLQSAWNKYGKSNFESFCIELCDENNLQKQEQYWIKKTKCLDNRLGYNINPYADRIKHTAQQKQKISLSMLGKSKRHGMESGITRIQNKYGDSWRVELAFRNKRHFLGTFKIKKIAEMIRLDTLGRILEGKQPNWSLINRHRVHRFRRIEQMDQRGDVIRVYDSAEDIEIAGFYLSSVRRACNGHAKSYRGYEWNYENEDERS